MTVLQHYFTSYIHRATGQIGFQVKAMSPGLSMEMQAEIERLIAYTIPPSLDDRAIETHPVALRYVYSGPDNCIFLCSQSTGNDDNGRPGNFFAHTLVMNPGIFRIAPPIFYWKSPFWQKKDAEERATLASLPALPAFHETPALDFEKLWDFLGQDGRRALLYKLMCAVVHYNSTFRRIVILDTTENIVWWIAAISCLLPPVYRPLLSFATYHHDPSQGHFMVTGTTNDSLFRASARDYYAYFVLNAETGRTSEIEASSYAQFVSEAITADRFESQLLPLFANYTQHFQNPTPIIIDEQLDLLV